MKQRRVSAVVAACSATCTRLESRVIRGSCDVLRRDVPTCALWELPELIAARTGAIAYACRVSIVTLVHDFREKVSWRATAHSVLGWRLLCLCWQLRKRRSPLDAGVQSVLPQFFRCCPDQCSSARYAAAAWARPAINRSYYCVFPIITLRGEGDEYVEHSSLVRRSTV